MTLQITRKCGDSDPDAEFRQPFLRFTMPTCHAGKRRGSNPTQIRDRKASDSTRIPRKMAVNGAQTCVSNQTNKRKNPHEYAE
jgi:hypothetical protein